MYKRGTKKQEFDQVFLAPFYRGKDTMASTTQVSRESHKQFIISLHGPDVKLFKAPQYLLFGIHVNQYPEYC